MKITKKKNINLRKIVKTKQKMKMKNINLKKMI